VTEPRREPARRVPPLARLLGGALGAVLLPVVGVAGYAVSDHAAREDPQRGLQQLDLLFLDEPAPGLAATGAPPGQVTVLLFCADCAAPRVTGGAVVRVRDPGLARQYGLGAPGRPGYAVVDAGGRVRYRTYDPHPGAHDVEVQTLVDGVAGRGR
jgi:hypothetical protein